MNYRVIKEDDVFLLTDEAGDVRGGHAYELGLYSKDTRYLSELSLLINGEKPIPLHSDGGENECSKILLTNPHQENESDLILWRESVELERTRFIDRGVLYETIKAKNFYPKSVTFRITVVFDADFADMFIVRGFQNGEVGTRGETIQEEQQLTFTYKGSDDMERKTVISWNRESCESTESSVSFEWTLAHLEEKEVTLSIAPSLNGEIPVIRDLNDARANLAKISTEWNEQLPKVTTDVQDLEKLIGRGTDDLRVLLTDVGFGRFPVAGLPWFGVPFGRDSLIAALQLLPFNQEVAKGTLRTMAHYQGTKVDPWRDEQPGKIMHEIRYGELANTNQIPFSPYYGTVDATPLFLILLVEYVKWTNDLSLFEELKPNAERALKWIDEYGDRDGDLFVEYHQEASKGIANQGWKDSGDSIVHRNGDYANSPIALSEVQGYVYQAKTGLAEIYQAAGLSDHAEQLKAEAAALKKAFNEAFWDEELSYFAIALDEHKERVGTITSNPGHLLQAGIIDQEKVEMVVRTLTGEEMFSGYGIRTMAEGEAGYNPMSYHNGSVWPHDNSMIILGMSKSDHQQAMATVIEGLVEASRHFEYHRLPELFCGYDQSKNTVVPYPVACSPQAWAAGTPLTFIQSILGLFPNSLNKEIVMNPFLLSGMNELKVEQMRIGDGVLSVHIQRHKHDLEVRILENTTGYEVKHIPASTALPS